MSADYSSFGLALVSWGATYLIHSTCLVAGVWLFLRIRSSSGHALRETLWKTGLIGGIVTTPVQLLLAPPGPFGSLTFAVGESRQAIVEEIRAVTDLRNAPESAGEQSISDQLVALETQPADNDLEVWNARSGAPPGSTDAPAIAVQTPAIDAGMPVFRHGNHGRWLDHVQTAWAVMVFVISALISVTAELARCLWQSLSLKRRLARCSSIEDGLPRRLLDELRAMVPRAPEVLLLSAPDDPEPAAFGVRRWTIVLPERAVGLPEDDLRALLAHELAHLVRGDSCWLWISRIVCSCLAFQPLNQLARREWQRAAEFLCDNWAVNRTGSSLALARCLTEVAGWRLSGRASEALLAATGRKSGLVDRIERLLDARPLGETWNEMHEQGRIVIAGGLVLALLAWCAPRVQVAWAGTKTVPGTPYAVLSESTVGATVAVKPEPETGGGSDAEPGGGMARELPADQNDSEKPAVAVIADAPPGLAPDLTTLLKSLDRDLSALERELETLEPLLFKDDAAPAVVNMVERLRRDLTRLKQRRTALLAYWKMSVD
jgi:hypothetical protein